MPRSLPTPVSVSAAAVTPATVIRTATPLDADRMGFVFYTAYNASIANMTTEEQRAPIKLADRVDFWRRYFQTSPDGAQGLPPLVAEVGDAGIVGLALALPDPKKRPGVAELSKLYVLPEFHGTGVASQLLEAVEEQMRRGFDKAWLEVLMRNRRARAFYSRRGWQTTGERIRVRIANTDVKRDSVILERDLTLPTRDATVGQREAPPTTLVAVPPQRTPQDRRPPTPRRPC